jgi:hypothetical protein
MQVRSPRLGPVEWRQAVLKTYVQVLPADDLKSRTFCFVIDKRRIDDVGIDLNLDYA